MAKESYYFTHDYFSRKDPKCLALIQEYGAAGYGIYWMLIEMMYEQGGKIKKFPSLYKALSFEFNIPEDDIIKQIDSMTNQFELLLQDASHIWSDSILRRLQIRENKFLKKAEAGRIGGIKSGESRRNEANRSNGSSITKQTNQRKGKEIKENRGIDFLPDLLEVVFADGSTQKLGEVQSLEFKNGNLLPKQVSKGNIC